MSDNNIALQITRKALIYIFMTIFAVFLGFPFLWMVITSLKTSGQIFIYPPVFIPDPVQLSNYTDAWVKASFSKYFFNSVFVTVLTVAGQITTSSLAAYSFSRLHYKGRDKIFLTYLATMMIPFPVVMVPNFVIMRVFHWLNSYQALIVPSIFTAYGTFMLRQFFMSIPSELDEAATIDGSSKFGIFCKIIMPLSKPGIITLCVFSFIGSWNSFLWPLLVTNKQNMFTLPLGLAIFRGFEYNIQYNLLLAGTVICILPILVIYLLAQKFFVEGIALSGIKG
ncbi:carbohydrate ABC transporter permease [Ruminiclostridium cellobioparum]|uniref:carbohydrate ABC transporter permease n=1 Tax=Ruminiclostridium cellobioparum TaxID=29355 RepID=UPI000685FDE8|nr:carbohydrate ABC transporter permease [Ruminiclostridium cellobioparum]